MKTNGSDMENVIYGLPCKIIVNISRTRYILKPIDILTY